MLFLPKRNRKEKEISDKKHEYNSKFETINSEKLSHLFEDLSITGVC